MALQALRKRVSLAITPQKLNVIAFSGGIDSSLVTKLVFDQAPSNSVACIGSFFFLLFLPYSSYKGKKEKEKKILRLQKGVFNKWVSESTNFPSLQRSISITSRISAFTCKESS